MIKWLVISIIALIILGNLGFDIKKSVHSPVAQSNLEYAKDVTVFVWQKYLKEPAKFLWSEVFIKYIWEPSIKILDKKVKGETSVNQQDAFFLPLSPLYHC